MKEARAMEKYHRGWDLRSIPASEIPEDALISWWSSYRVRHRPKKATKDPKEREYLDKQAERMRRLREQRKAGEVR